MVDIQRVLSVMPSHDWVTAMDLWWLASYNAHTLTINFVSRDQLFRVLKRLVDNKYFELEERNPEHKSQFKLTALGQRAKRVCAEYIHEPAPLAA